MTLGVVDKWKWWLSWLVEWNYTWALHVVAPSICSICIWNWVVVLNFLCWPNIAEFWPILLMIRQLRCIMKTFLGKFSGIIKVQWAFVSMLEINRFLQIQVSFVMKTFTCLVITISKSFTTLISDLHHWFIHQSFLTFQLLNLVMPISMNSLNKWFVLIAWQLPRDAFLTIIESPFIIWAKFIFREWHIL